MDIWVKQPLGSVGHLFMGDQKSLLALNALRDVYAVAIHNIKLSRERQVNQISTYPVPEFLVEDKSIN